MQQIAEDPRGFNGVPHIACQIRAIAHSATENNVNYTLAELDEIAKSLRAAYEQVSCSIRLRLGMAE